MFFLCVLPDVRPVCFWMCFVVSMRVYLTCSPCRFAGIYLPCSSCRSAGIYLPCSSCRSARHLPDLLIPPFRRHLPDLLIPPFRRHLPSLLSLPFRPASTSAASSCRFQPVPTFPAYPALINSLSSVKSCFRLCFGVRT